MDGQHRLSAVVAAGVPVPMFVVDAEPLRFTTIDTAGRGKTRFHVRAWSSSWRPDFRPLLRDDLVSVGKFRRRDHHARRNMQFKWPARPTQLMGGWPGMWS